MTDVEFDEEQEADTITKKRSYNLHTIIQKIGLARSDKEADGILIVIAVVCLLIALGVLIKYFAPASFILPVHTITKQKS